MDIDDIAVITDRYAMLLLPKEQIDYMRESQHWEHFKEYRVWVNRLMIPDGREIFRH